MRRATPTLFMAYSLAVYAGFLAVFAYAVGFVQQVGVPIDIDDSASTSTSTAAALAIDLALLVLFAVQHSIMARPAFKRRWTRLVPEPIERSTYVLAASLALALLLWRWRPLPATVWHLEPTAARTALHTLAWLGWLTVLGTTFLINHLDMFGLRQAYRHLRDRPPAAPELQTPLLYRLVRHPLMLGFIIAFWAAPTMSQGRLLFAAVSTGYILVALQLEERDLLDELGDDYHAYRRDVPMLLPGLIRRASPAARVQQGGDGERTTPKADAEHTSPQ
ncbi:MAG: methanethiol S-methyltransferase [Acidimicrobiales bacterium]